MNNLSLFPTCHCPNCDSTNLSWISSVKTNGVVDGRLRAHEVQPIFVLGCDECSETLQVVDGDKVASLVNELWASFREQGS